MHTSARLGLVVQEERKTLGLSVWTLAKRAGVGRRFVRDTEAGRAPADLGSVLRILDVLGIKPLALPSGLAEAA